VSVFFSGVQSTESRVQGPVQGPVEALDYALRDTLIKFVRFFVTVYYWTVSHWTPCCFWKVLFLSLKTHRNKDNQSAFFVNCENSNQCTVIFSWFWCLLWLLIGKRPSCRPNYFVCNHTRNRVSSNSYSRLSRSSGGHICCRLKSEVFRFSTDFCVDQQWSNKPFLGLHLDQLLFKYESRWLFLVSIVQYWNVYLS